MLDDIYLFITVVKSGSLNKAANKLGMPAPTLSRRLQRLEKNLGRQLIYRSARRFELSSDGLEYYQAYVPIIEQYEKTTNQIEGNQQQLSGELTILAPTNISVGFLMPMWIDFIKAYPEIRLNLLLNNKNEDFITNKADLAIRVGKQADSNLYQKKLCAANTLLVASKGYINQYGEPASIEELTDHHFVASEFLVPWNLTHQKTGKTTQFFPTTTAKANDLQLITQFVIAGLGISLLPTIEINTALKNNQLKQILPDWQGEQRTIYTVWGSGKLLNPRAKLFRNYLQTYLTENFIN